MIESLYTICRRGEGSRGGRGVEGGGEMSVGDTLRSVYSGSHITIQSAGGWPALQSRNVTSPVSKIPTLDSLHFKSILSKI